MGRKIINANQAVNIMKNSYLRYSMLAMLVMALGCVSTGETTENARKDDKTIAVNLTQYFRQVPGLTVNGSGRDASVLVRRPSSIMSSKRPLFVLDGIVIGQSFERLHGLVRVQDIDYVKVLKGPDAGAYGMRGSNGVILVVTKKN